MKVYRRTNFLWGLVLVVAALTLTFHALDMIPNGIYDVIARAWPALLVLAGLSIFLRQRVPFGSGVALIVSLVVVGGIATVAFSTRTAQERNDYQQAIAQPVSADVTLLQVNVETLATDVEVVRSVGTERQISGQFVGSTESRVQVDYAEPGEGRGMFHVYEQQPNQFPLLEAVGRGRLRLELPPGVALDVAFHGMNGGATFTMTDLSLERLNLDLEHGNALVTFPNYKPLSPSVAQEPGNLNVRDGAITIFVPQAVSGRFELNRGGSGIRPEFDDQQYYYLEGDVLQGKTYDSADIKLRYVVTAPHGLIQVQTPQS